ncbi:hypothetical protein ACPWT1_06805 [Ramlibacter sp. MMS24-I3-19]|uniref:hypothetical protein n=1 Tax=Ramlibacter sp. MMS24-I3-19 TaxID=3416606 RepID=UPI003D0796FF
MAQGPQSRTTILAALRRSSVALAVAALAACGGGGGGGGGTTDASGGASAGGTAPPPASTATPVAAGSPISGGGSVGSTGSTGTASGPTAASSTTKAAAFQRTDFQVNTTTAGSQSGGVVAHLANGGYVAVWDSRAMEFGGSEIRMQRFDAQGQPLGAEQLVAAQGNYAQVAAFADGRFLVTWRLSPFAYEVDAHGAMFDAQGVQIGSTMQLGSGFNSFQPRPLALPDGTFMLAIDTDDGKYSAPLGLVQHFAADGTALGQATRLESQLSVQTGSYSPNSAGQARMALLADGRIATAWVASGTNSSELRLSLFDGQAQSLGAATVLDARSMPITAPSIAALPDGGYAVTWATGASGQPQTAFLEVFDADGTSRARRQLAASAAGQSGQITPRVTTLADGSLEVAWDSMWWDGTLSRRVLWTQHVDRNGAPLTDAQQVDAQGWTTDNLPSDSLDLAPTTGSGFLLLYGRWTARDSWEVRAGAH